jgi:hypothetical protein
MLLINVLLLGAVKLKIKSHEASATAGGSA